MSLYRKILFLSATVGLVAGVIGFGPLYKAGAFGDTREMISDLFITIRDYLRPAKQQPPNSPPTVETACSNKSALPTAIKVVVIPGKANLAENDLPQLRNALGCGDFEVIYGTRGRFAGHPANAISYNGSLDFRKISILVDALTKMNIALVSVCNVAPEIPPNTVWISTRVLLNPLSGDIVGTLPPLDRSTLGRLIGARSQQDFDSNIKQSSC
jgi:hypothetical protein